MATHDPDERFNVVVFFKDGHYEYVLRNLLARPALEAAYHHTHNVSANVGLTQRVILTDTGDCIAFEWRYGEGVVFPKLETKKSYKKEPMCPACGGSDPDCKN